VFRHIRLSGTLIEREGDDELALQQSWDSESQKGDQRTM